jgi:phosphoglucomutase
VEGEKIPKQKMLIFELMDGTRIAVRGSGTEPKLKYYLFGRKQPRNGNFDPDELATIKTKVGEWLNAIWDWIQKDARARLSG